ncbi:GH32 C-terminal domain-containing protein [Streptomyces sp. NPDC006332]|uniref:GH32 C-terminal domain-containing protein n=1 Tax=Streptomyces sp. NPDC006332 TaxID=3155456 RepID=UPI0033B985BD
MGGQPCRQPRTKWGALVGRRRGATDFDPTFSGVQRAPLDLHDGRLSLHVLVDASSVDVYAQNRCGEQVTLTDQIFPAPASTGIDAFAEGGTGCFAP